MALDSWIGIRRFGTIRFQPKLPWLFSTIAVAIGISICGCGGGGSAAVRNPAPSVSLTSSLNQATIGQSLR